MIALVLGGLAPVLDLVGVLDPVGALDEEVVQAAGGGMFFGGLVGTLLAQIAKTIAAIATTNTVMVVSE